MGISNNVNLIELDCSNNELKELDCSKNINLKYLNCSHNKLKELDFSNNIDLKRLNLTSPFKIYEHDNENELITFNLSKNANLIQIIGRCNDIPNFSLHDSIDLLEINETAKRNKSQLENEKIRKIRNFCIAGGIIIIFLIIYFLKKRKKSK